MGSLNRIGYLSKIEIYESRYLLTLYLPAVAVWTALLLWLSGSNVISWNSAQELLKFSIYSLFIIGAVLASWVFADAHDRRRRVITAQLLPAKAWEQVTAKWLTSFAVWFIVWSAGIYLTLLITDNANIIYSAAPATWIHLGVSGTLMTTVQDIYNVIAAFAIWHSLFFFGGIYFRRLRLLKTAMVVIALAAVMILSIMEITGLEKETLFVFIPGLTSIDSCTPLLVNIYVDPVVSNRTFLLVEKLTLVVPVFLWWLSVIRLQETER